MQKGKRYGQSLDAIASKTGGRCWYCGKELPDRWHVDHQVPVSAGGVDSPDNLVPACPKCNLNKSDLTVENYRRAVSLNPRLKLTLWQISELERLDEEDNRKHPVVVFYGESIAP